MITKEEYKKALGAIKAYHEQERRVKYVFVGENMCVKDWIGVFQEDSSYECGRSTIRVYNVLMWGNIKHKTMKTMVKEFSQYRNVGKKMKEELDRMIKHTKLDCLIEKK